MLSKSKFYISKQTSPDSYLYFEIPFRSIDRSIVHVIDHIQSVRLSNNESVSQYRCETYTGFNTYSVEIQFVGSPTNQALEDVIELLFFKPITQIELDQAKQTTYLESMKHLIQRKGVFIQFYDYQALSLRSLGKEYANLLNVKLSDINQVLQQLIGSTKITIAHVKNPDDLAKFLPTINLYKSENEVNHSVEKLYKLPKVINCKPKENSLSFVEIIYQVPTLNLCEYEKATIKYAIFHDILRDYLYKLGLSYGVELLVNETCYQNTHMIFSMQTIPGSEEKLVEIVGELLAKPLTKYLGVEKIFQDQLCESLRVIKTWQQNQLETDFNHAWQDITFGEENYVTPEKLEAQLKAMTLEKIQTDLIAIPSSIIIS